MIVLRLPAMLRKSDLMRVPRPSHWILLGGLFVLLAAAALLWSTRGLGRTDPYEIHGSTAAIGARAAAHRDVSVLGFSLRCMDALRKGEARQAIELCSLVLDLDPRNVAALNLRGNAYVRLGLNTKALADFSSIIRLDPANAEGYRLRAGVYALGHRNALALADYDRAVALAPKEALAIEARGHFYQTIGNYPAAIADLSVVIARVPLLARAWNSRCWTRFLSNRELSQALADCDRSLQLDATSANAHDSRGFVLYRLNRFGAAIVDFNKAIALNAKLASARYGRGLSKLRLKDLSAARDSARAKVIEPGIAERFAGYGIRPHASGPSGA